ncbi:hypothetical protein [Pedobacter miscanthi]|uniref:Alpha-L-fucosidase C-terminal domain-containing protein n=1 Tax=Pedobacter miscanthi TaxID=2259170 RepID=A0A366KL63_9SPHI|nr:hypothetical protein [Pedobacter miscanthi]RBQ02426.1 hypothetical protein DRW42_26810 [Pedobacter miscanthi]
MTSEPMNSTTNIRTLEPIIFYSGKEDELQIFLNETEYGELIIISLSDDQLKVKEVLLEETNEKLEWKQDYKGLRISVPEGLEIRGRSMGRVLKVTF